MVSLTLLMMCLFMALITHLSSRMSFSFLDRCVEKDLHLNPDKIHINVPNVPFFGQVLTSKGLQPDPHKVDVIQQWPTPTCVSELQSFLGSVNYLCKFIPYLLDLCQPLQELLKKSNEFCLDTCP